MEFYAGFLGIRFYPFAGNQSRKVSDALAISCKCLRRSLMWPTIGPEWSIALVVQIESHCHADIWQSQFHRA